MRTEAHLSLEYGLYIEDFVTVKSESQLMRDCHLGCITAAEHCIELLHKYKKPVYLAIYRAGPKTRELEKAEIRKMLEQ